MPGYFEAQYRVSAKAPWTFGGTFEDEEAAKERCRRLYKSQAAEVRVLDHTPRTVFEFKRT